MALQAKEKEIELILTYKCNWDCDYCCVDTHNRNPLSLQQVKEKLSKVIPGYNVTLSGGEIGTMDKEDILYVLEYLKGINCPTSLNTNGLFLQRYPELAHYFEYVLYHCSEDLVKDPDYDSVVNFLLNNFDCDLEFMLVVTDNNLNNLDGFLKRNLDHDFHVVAATLADGGLDVTLSNKNRYAIMAKRYTNVTPDSIKRLIVKEKSFDSIIYI